MEKLKDLEIGLVKDQILKKLLLKLAEGQTIDTSVEVK